MKLNTIFNKIDNSQLVLFRIFYGIILFFECAGGLAIGWVKSVYDVPKDTFGFIGFEFLPHPKLETYYLIYALMAVLGVLMALGYRYRLSALLMALLWTFTYLTHKVHYNNHHYLMFLLNWMMVFVPAHHFKSLDVRQKRTEEKQWCRQWHVWMFVGLLGIAYTYAAIAKMYPDWMRAVPLKQWLAAKENTPIIGFFYSSEISAYIMAWGGLVFDLFVIPLLLWKPTRKIAFIVSVFFHLSNSITFQIGTFPYTMIAAGVLFFPVRTVQQRFFKNKPFFEAEEAEKMSSKMAVTKALLVAFFVVQIALPLRHHFIEGNVYWTEEGHRLSWRMMLRAKSGTIDFKIYENGERRYHDIREDLSPTQLRMVRVKPDFMWQYVQRLKQQFPNATAIYVDSKVQLNDHGMNPFIDPEYNMLHAKWNYFGHSDWIMPFKGWKDGLE